MGKLTWFEASSVCFQQGEGTGGSASKPVGIQGVEDEPPGMTPDPNVIPPESPEKESGNK